MEKGVIELNVLVFTAMIEESENILLNHNFERESVLSKEYSNLFEAYKIDMGEICLILIRPSIDPLHKTGLFGTEIAFGIVYIGIKIFNPDLVINIGYAGLSTKKSSYVIGDIIIAKSAEYHRREMIITQYKDTTEGKYPVEECKRMVKELGFLSDRVGTSNSFVYFDEVAERKGISIVEMELCSVARACYYFNKKCIGVKIISDTPNHEDSHEKREDDFLSSLTLLRKSFYEGFSQIIEYLRSKSLPDILE